MILRDVAEQDLQSLLKFMYSGEVQISEDRLKNFLRTAETLQIRGLTDGDASMTTTTPNTMTDTKEEQQCQKPTSSPAVSYYYFNTKETTCCNYFIFN